MPEVTGLMDALPVMNAAGMIKTEADAARFVELPVPAVLMGSFTVEERQGNSGTTFFDAPGFGSLNSLGLPGPGLDDWSERVASVRTMTASAGKELWVSVAGFSASEFGALAEAAAIAGADRIELNLGCPNVIEDGQRKAIASYNSQAVYDAVSEAVGRIPSGARSMIGVKLSPILDSGLLDEVAAVLNGFEAVGFVTAVNTVPNCLALEGGRQVIDVHDGLGGMGGPALKWIALGQLQQLGMLLRQEIELIGVGGITNGNDVHEFLSIDRVTRCQVATAIWRSGPKALLVIGQDYAESVSD